MWEVLVLLDSKKEEKIDRIMILVSSFGSIIVMSSIIHASYTQILPLTQLTAGVILIGPSIFIGLLNDDLRDALKVMVLTVLGTIFLTIFIRSIPAFIGVFSTQTDVFIFQQIAETLPLFFLMIPFSVIGTVTGSILSEFLFKY